MSNRKVALAQELLKKLTDGSLEYSKIYSEVKRNSLERNIIYGSKESELLFIYTVGKELGLDMSNLPVSSKGQKIDLAYKLFENGKNVKDIIVESFGKFSESYCAFILRRIHTLKLLGKISEDEFLRFYYRIYAEIPAKGKAVIISWARNYIMREVVEHILDGDVKTRGGKEFLKRELSDNFTVATPSDREIFEYIRKKGYHLGEIDFQRFLYLE